MHCSQNRATYESFGNLKAAVQFLEVVYNYPMHDINNLAADEENYARIRFGIGTDELSLQLKSLWDNDWNLQMTGMNGRSSVPNHE